MMTAMGAAIGLAKASPAASGRFNGRNMSSATVGTINATATYNTSVQMTA
jgi:hypothetical protein